jgi:hypothetical protein
MQMIKYWKWIIPVRSILHYTVYLLKEECEDTKGVIRIRQIEG